MKSIKLSLTLLLVMGMAVTAQENKRSDVPVVRPFVTEHVISFESELNKESFTLRVSGPDGIHFSKVFDSADEIYIDPVDQDGYDLFDGLYIYEITATPIVSDEMRVTMREARETGDYSNVVLPERKAPFSGTFRVVNGLFVLPDNQETNGYVANNDHKQSKAETSEGRDSGDRAGTATTSNDAGTVDVANNGTDLDEPGRDQVIADDLIVDGSACIGADCVNGESFGFDTIRIKENNLRIKAQDTSSSGSFPSNDWQLTFNDSSNGGANKFAIDDIDSGKTPFTIEAGAPGNSLYVDDSGRIGIGTAAPVVNAHIVEGNSPTLRLEQDGSSGFTPQTWDLAGNEANFFVRDVTNGSKLPFKIKPSAPTSSIFVAANGDVGLGDESPDGAFDVESGNLVVSDGDISITSSTPNNGFKTGTFRVEQTTESDTSVAAAFINNGQVTVSWEDTSRSTIWNTGSNSSSQYYISKSGSGLLEMAISSGGNVTIGGTLTEGSDANRKENFGNIDSLEILNRVNNLPITTWNYTHESDQVRHLGPMAQDFYAAFGLGETNLGIASIDKSGVALSAIQGLSKLGEEKDAEIKSLKEQLKAQEARLQKLEALLLD